MKIPLLYRQALTVGRPEVPTTVDGSIGRLALARCAIRQENIAGRHFSTPSQVVQNVLPFLIRVVGQRPIEIGSAYTKRFLKYQLWPSSSISDSLWSHSSQTISLEKPETVGLIRQS